MFQYINIFRKRPSVPGIWCWNIQYWNVELEQEDDVQKKLSVGRAREQTQEQAKE